MMLVPKGGRKRRRTAGVMMVSAGPRRALPAVPRTLRGVARIGGFYGRFAGPRAELKFLDTTKALTNMTTAGVVLDDSLNHIPQGNSESERIGRKVVLKMLRMKGQIINSLSTVIGNMEQRFRVVVYCDKQTNGTPATAVLIFGAAPTIDSFRDLANQDRFQILYDKTREFTIPAVAQTAAGTFSSYNVSKNFSLNVRLNIPIEFDSTATDGSIATIRSNNVGILAFCQTGDSPVSIQYIARIRYSDSG